MERLCRSSSTLVSTLALENLDVPQLNLPYPRWRHLQSALDIDDDTGLEVVHDQVGETAAA
jgi:hypothetical protein